jgi:hypothetical protein
VLPPFVPTEPGPNFVNLPGLDVAPLQTFTSGLSDGVVPGWFNSCNEACLRLSFRMRAALAKGLPVSPCTDDRSS